MTDPPVAFDLDSAHRLASALAVALEALRSAPLATADADAARARVADVLAGRDADVHGVWRRLHRDASGHSISEGP